MLKYFFSFLMSFFSFVFVSQQLNTHTISGDNNITDTYIDNVLTSQNYANWNPIEVSVVQNGSTYRVKRILIHFNLSSIPSNAIIQSANLELNCQGQEVAVTNSSIKVERVDPVANTSLWNATTTWNNQPSTVTSDAVSLSTLVNNFRTFDVTNHVRNMYNNVYQNFGWMISMRDENVISKGTYTAENSSIRPKLTITWYYPYSISTATITHASSSLTTDGAINANVINGPSIGALQWFDGSTPTPTAIPGATTSTLSNVKAGWYGLRVTGSHGAPFYMAFLVGIKCQNATINFKPDGNYFDDAVVVEGAFKFNNYGTYHSNYTLRTENNGNIYDSKTYLKPRIWYDPSFNFISADLTLKGNNHVLSGSNATELKLSNTNWSETQITWSNMPTFLTTPQIVIPSTASAYENKVISILPFVNLWKSNNLTNYGAVFQLQFFTSPQKGMNFHSSDASLASNRPEINFVINLENLAGCTAATINDLSYSVLKDKIDAGYARTVQGKFRFSFFEEQTINNSKYVPFQILNQNNEVVASSDLSGSVTGGITPILFKDASNLFQRNIYQLDISNVTGLSVGSYFTLVVTDLSNDKKYLKVLYKN